MLFQRPPQTYAVSENTLSSILQDTANPLMHIAKEVSHGSTVLDIGAGNGILSDILNHDNKNCVIDGIEPAEAARDLCLPKYRRFFSALLQDVIKDVKTEQYDYVILADVVEHIPDPIPFLESLSQLLKPGGKILLSVPNIAYGGIRLSLYNGSFQYVDSGILEKTHLRFFTLQTLLEVFEYVKLSPQKTYYCQRNILQTDRELIKKSIRNRFATFGMLGDPLAHVYQFMFVLGDQSTSCENIYTGKRLTTGKLLTSFLG